MTANAPIAPRQGGTRACPRAHPRLEAGAAGTRSRSTASSATTGRSETTLASQGVAERFAARRSWAVTGPERRRAARTI